MEEELEKRIIDLCYKVLKIYQKPLMNIVIEYDKREAINRIFFGRETGVIKHVSDFLIEKPEASEEEIAKFVEKEVNKAKDKTLALIPRKTYEGKSVESIVSDTYDEIIECIVKEKNTLILDNNEEVENELPKQDIKEDYEDSNADDLEFDEEVEPRYEDVIEETPKEENIKDIELDEDEIEILEEALEKPVEKDDGFDPDAEIVFDEKRKEIEDLFEKIDAISKSR